jgi:hypothetical protein
MHPKDATISEMVSMCYVRREKPGRSNTPHMEAPKTSQPQLTNENSTDQSTSREANSS